MKNLIVASLIALGTLGMSAQESKINVNVGDVFEIASPSGQEFQHIHFPKKNFIIKRGGIASDKLVYGEEVVVTKVTTTKDGSIEVRIKRTDSGRFYNALRSVTVNFEEAINSGELKI